MKTVPQGFVSICLDPSLPAEKWPAEAAFWIGLRRPFKEELKLAELPPMKAPIAVESGERFVVSAEAVPCPHGKVLYQATILTRP